MGCKEACGEDGDNKVATIEWDEPGSYSSGLTFKPHLKVASDSTRPNGSSFDVALKNFKKTIWNDTPNADRTSGTQIATMKVTVIDGAVPEKITTHALVDYAPNWALKKHDTYNTRLGAYLIKNELGAQTRIVRVVLLKRPVGRIVDERMGAYLIKNELASPTLPKTLEMTIDEGNTAMPSL